VTTKTRSPIRNFAALQSECEMVPLSDISPAERIPRVHSKAKRQRLRLSMSHDGQIVPVIISQAGMLVDGHARVQAARELGWPSINAIRLDRPAEDLRVIGLAVNKLCMDSDWDTDVLNLLFDEIQTSLPELSLDLSGFSTPEIDTIRGAYAAKQMNDLVDEVPELPDKAPPVSMLGDEFDCGGHRVRCGDARDPEALAALMGEDEAQQIFTDPPYNVKIEGHVTVRGKHHHSEFAVAAGDLSSDEFTAFLRDVLHVAAEHLADGGLAHVCMDHAHVGELLTAGAQVFSERKSICVWDKGSGAMGSLYRNAYELVVVFKKGTAKHINNIELGKHGRNRTTVWRYPGIAQQGSGKANALSLHPTIKPCALVADAILDASDPGAIILDPFGGSGTTMIAAERTKRRARLLELDPSYVDTIVTRYQDFTQELAIHVETGLSFAELRNVRATAAEKGE
jgi:DNA modification methylase